MIKKIFKLALLVFKRIAAKIVRISTFSKKGLFLAIVFAIILRIKKNTAESSNIDPCIFFLNSAIGLKL